MKHVIENGKTIVDEGSAQWAYDKKELFKFFDSHVSGIKRTYRMLKELDSGIASLKLNDAIEELEYL